MRRHFLLAEQRRRRLVLLLESQALVVRALVRRVLVARLPLKLLSPLSQGMMMKIQSLRLLNGGLLDSLPVARVHRLLVATTKIMRLLQCFPMERQLLFSQLMVPHLTDLILMIQPPRLMTKLRQQGLQVPPLVMMIYLNQQPLAREMTVKTMKTPVRLVPLALRTQKLEKLPRRQLPTELKRLVQMTMMISA
jgi:hypothetical protein